MIFLAASDKLTARPPKGGGVVKVFDGAEQVLEVHYASHHDNAAVTKYALQLASVKVSQPQESLTALGLE